MQKDLTDIVVVLDRSGSMSACQKEAEGGLNAFIENQKKLPGKATFTLVQFDHTYEFVYTAKPIADVLYHALVPRGNTALLDAVGRAIVETGERLGKMSECDRPGLVVFVILTDGQENSSREFTRAKIKEMIQHQTDVYKWQFTFLGANQDAFAEAGAMGIAAAGTSNYEEKTAGMAFAAASANVGRMRSASAGGQSIHNIYTPEEKKAMEGKV